MSLQIIRLQWDVMQKLAIWADHLYLDMYKPGPNIPFLERLKPWSNIAFTLPEGVAWYITKMRCGSSWLCRFSCSYTAFALNSRDILIDVLATELSKYSAWAPPSLFDLSRKVGVSTLIYCQCQVITYLNNPDSDSAASVIQTWISDQKLCKIQESWSLVSV